MTIRERANESVLKYVHEEYNSEYKLGFYNGYSCGANEQDPISRADERKKVIEKVKEWIKGLACIEGTDFLLLDQNPMRPEIQLDVDAMIEQFEQLIEK